MRLKEIRKHVGRTIGLANFSSVRFDTELSAIVDENESVDDAEQKLWDLANQYLARDIERWKEKRKNGRTQED